VQDGKLARASSPPKWIDVVRDALVLAQDKKKTCASFQHGGICCWRCVYVYVKEKTCKH
jgi:hypothetical protein